RGYLLDVQRLARVTLPGGEAVEHVHLVRPDHHAPVATRDRQPGDRLRLARNDRFEDLLHLRLPPLGVGWTLLNGSFERNVPVAKATCHDAGSTSSTSTPPASLGWTKLIREPPVPLLGD